MIEDSKTLCTGFLDAKVDNAKSNNKTKLMTPVTQFQTWILYKCSTIYNDIGCEYDGECLPLHMIIQEGCSWKKCVIAAEGPNFIDTRLITEHGKIA